AGEMGDRSLPVGPGDGGDRLWLPAIEPRGGEGKAALRVGVGDDRDAVPLDVVEVERGGVVGQDRDRALAYRLGRETAAVGPRAGPGREQETRPHLAGI